MKWLTYPAFLLLRELGIVGMIRTLLVICLTGGALAAATLPTGPLWAVLAYLAIASLWLLLQEIGQLQRYCENSALHGGSQEPINAAEWLLQSIRRGFQQWLNREQHLIIRNSIFLMEDVANEIDLTEGRAELGYLPCIWREVVQAAEWAGQARALGTGIAATGQSSPEQRVRMRFLYQKIELLAGTAFATLQRHATDHPQADVFRLQHREQVVEDFLRCTKEELLDQIQPVIAAKTYFQRATQGIDELLALVDAALAQLQPR
ncbi:hypothetical protein [Pseudomonas mohnii]